MTSDACPKPLGWKMLVDYWLGDLRRVEEKAAEAHLFACASCSAGLAEVAALSKGLRLALGGTTLQPVVTQATLDALRNQGVRPIEVTIAPGHEVEVIIPKNVDMVVARLSADLARAQRVNVEICASDGRPYYIAQDVPFEAGRGEVLVLCQRHVAIENRRVLFRLLAVERRGEKAASEYAMTAAEE